MWWLLHLFYKVKPVFEIKQDGRMRKEGCLFLNANLHKLLQYCKHLLQMLSRWMLGNLHYSRAREKKAEVNGQSHFMTLLSGLFCDTSLFKHIGTAYGHEYVYVHTQSPRLIHKPDIQCLPSGDTKEKRTSSIKSFASHERLHNVKCLWWFKVPQLWKRDVKGDNKRAQIQDSVPLVFFFFLDFCHGYFYWWGPKWPESPYRVNILLYFLELSKKIFPRGNPIWPCYLLTEGDF